ncbi:hypothetical protein LPB72_07555 [Hydrogenophaga crassostreae]|uniref:AB hydrolase-1 domain-containing protein n=1 Tax=Hydrogenophaga crassostreae TaxID=1763535 RepID=A0A162Z162_9BURK|nr:alpha/beta hydrolase [Hydrogenophaga crassostreae]AOW15530.1 hypothetical protein LPB072_09815 [Hydrogenophaga crassostreae]OAD42801.1 hypothetical protein LPB72_07555 [Hydrogenophaga crassostreae]
MQTSLEINDLTVLVDGAGPTLVFVHGWPDGPALWEPAVTALKARYRCVRVTLPGFDLKKPPRPVSVDAMCGLLAEVVDEVSPTEPVTLVLHDWGCFFGYEFAARHRKRVEAVVGVDIGDTNSGAYLSQLTLKEKLLIAGYQLWLAVAWKLGPLWPGMASRMTRYMARAIGCRTPSETIAWQMNYPYAMQWFGSLGGLRGVARVGKFLGDEVPTLFIYGQRKPFMFHSRQWVLNLAKKPGCAAHGLETGHWVMRQQPEAFNTLLLNWLERRRADSGV